MSFHGTSSSACIHTGGCGANILFVHGWLHSSLIWTLLMRQLQAEFTVDALDLPGFGNSPPLPAELQNLDAYADWLGEFIQKRYPTSGPDLIVADSLGAILLLKFLNKSNLNIAGLALSGCPIEGLPLKMAPLKIKGAITAVLAVLKMIPATVASAIIKSFSFTTVHKMETVNKDLIKSVLAADPQTAEALLRQLFSPLNISDLNQINSDRTVVIRGQYDRIVSGKTVDKLEEFLNAENREIDNSGHTPMIENFIGYLCALSSVLPEGAG